MNNNSLGQVYLESAIKRLMSYKTLGDATFAQLEDKDFHFKPNEESNTLAVIINHMHGNMLSRWTNFLTEDGEKPDRNREQEFAAEPGASKETLLARWEAGWTCLLDTLRSLKEEDLLKTITIRHEPLPAVDAINRQLAHYPHHVGQIIYIGKMIRGENWQSLSIAKGASAAFNQFMQDKHARR